ncbi:MAG: hypothetical protein ACXWW8_05480 [Solirubrobacterales bacterium]
MEASSPQPPTSDPLVRAAAIGLAAGRLVIGAGLWLAPRPTLTALGFGELDAGGLALARIAATRDLVLGAWQLGSLNDDEQLRRATAAVAVADGGDSIAFVLGLRSRENRTAAGRGLAGALPATLAGAWLFSRL